MDAMRYTYTLCINKAVRDVLLPWLAERAHLIRNQKSLNCHMHQVEDFLAVIKCRIWHSCHVKTLKFKTSLLESNTKSNLPSSLGGKHPYYDNNQQH